jgi:hypothetical protein
MKGIAKKIIRTEFKTTNIKAERFRKAVKEMK